MGQIQIKTSALFVFKIIGISLLVVIEVYNLFRPYDPFREGASHFATPIMLILTYFVVIGLVFLEKIMGLISSTLLFTFWTLFLLFMSITLRTKILEQSVYRTAKLEDVIPFYVFYSLLVVMVILSTFSEKGVKTSSKGNAEFDNDLSDEFLMEEKPKLKMLPDNYAPLLSKLTFWWINDLIIKGYRKPLNRDDLWAIDEEESSAYLTRKLEYEWDKVTKTFLESISNKADLKAETINKKKW